MPIDPIMIGAGVFFVILYLLLLNRFRPVLVKITSDEALVRTRSIDVPIFGPKGTAVYFKGAYVLKAFDNWEKLKLATRSLEIERKYNNPVFTKDGKEIALKAIFQIQVERTEESVISVSQNIGCERASEQAVLQELFEPRFSEALEAAAGEMTAQEVTQQREQYRERVIEIVGADLDGFRLHDAAIKDLKVTK